VDDDELNHFILKDFLRDGGYSQIKSIVDPRKAIKTCQEFDPDLILLDYQMPYMDGFQVLKGLKEMQNEKKVLVMMVTSLNFPQTRKKAFELGVDDFAVKPAEAKEFIQQIDTLLSKRLIK
jgi:putative two-component system response regulator